MTSTAATDRPLRILQLSDTHLFADPEGRLLGVKTLAAMRLVLEQIRAEAGPLDLILATGDLVQDHSPDGYLLFQKEVSSLGIPIYALPGNHDHPQLMRQHLVGGLISMPFAAVHGQWLLILLDSSQPGTESGHLSDDSLSALEQQLKAHPQAQVLISVHHQPVPVGSPWLDAMMIDNADRLLAILDRHPNVRALIWGHVHQVFESSRNQIRLLSAPATCFQFSIQQASFGLDPLPPGCRLLELYPDGHIDTRVIRTAEIPESLEYSSAGY
jgi:Icc protein